MSEDSCHFANLLNLANNYLFLDKSRDSRANSLNTRGNVDHPREFVFKKSLNAHLIKHRIRNQLACKYCSAHVSTIPELDNHVLEIHQIDKNNLLIYCIHS